MFCAALDPISTVAYLPVPARLQYIRRSRYYAGQEGLEKQGVAVGLNDIISDQAVEPGLGEGSAIFYTSCSTTSTSCLDLALEGIIANARSRNRHRRAFSS